MIAQPNTPLPAPSTHAGLRAVEVPLVAGYCALLLLLVASGWGSVRALQSLEAGTAAVDHTEAVVEILKELELDVREAESALRSYVTSGEKSQLAEYRKQAFQELDTHTAALHGLTQNYPDQLRRLNQVEPLLHRSVTQMENLRQRFEAAPTEATRQEILTLNASRFTEPLVTSFEQFSATEQQHLAERQQLRAARAQRAIRNVVASGILGLLCVASALFLGLRGLRRRRRTEAQLEISLAEREILLKEVHHRVKNNLQVVSGLLSLEAEKLSDPKAQAVFTECRDRLHSMARLHEQLYGRGQFTSVDFAQHLNEMAAMLVDAHHPPDCRIALEVHIDPLTLDLDSAITLGLIANEVLLNSLKHAFSGRSAGSLRVDLRLGQKDVELTVRDDGAGLPAHFDARKSAGLGLELIFGLSSQIKGEAKIENAPGGGTCTTISFPRPPGSVGGQEIPAREDRAAPPRN